MPPHSNYWIFFIRRSNHERNKTKRPSVAFGSTIDVSKKEYDSDNNGKREVNTDNDTYHGSQKLLVHDRDAANERYESDTRNHQYDTRAEEVEPQVENAIPCAVLCEYHRGIQPQTHSLGDVFEQLPEDSPPEDEHHHETSYRRRRYVR
jgi:hypothetical protein